MESSVVQMLTPKLVVVEATALVHHHFDHVTTYIGLTKKNLKRIFTLNLANISISTKNHHA